jgi:hypothetical protein
LVEGIGYLGSVPSEAWMALTGAIIGSGLTLVGVWLTNRSSIEILHIQLAHERHAKREELYRARLEELYVMSSPESTLMRLSAIIYHTER